MHSKKLAALFAMLLFAPLFLQGETAEFAGRWEGSVRTPDQLFPLQIDLVASAEGAIRGAIQAENGTTGVPLKVEVKQRKITFHTRTDQSFSGELSADGLTITGDYAIAGYLLPFRIDRTGDGKLAPALRSSAIPKALEGGWAAAIEVSNARFRIRLDMRNQDAVWVSIDEGGLELPMSIGNEGGVQVTLAVPAIDARFVGAL